MRNLKMVGVLGALVLGAGTAVALTGPAAAATQDCKTVTTHLVDRPDSGLAGNWALDAITRTVKVCQTGEGTYHATVTDEGTFAATGGAKSPSGAVDLPAGVTGAIDGGFTADFQAAADWKSFDDSKLAGKTFTGTTAPATGTWVKSLFEDFKGSSLNDDWSWTYTTCDGRGETWVNATETVGGNSGDITGKACPSPEPTTEPTTEPTGEPTGGPTGGPTVEPTTPPVDGGAGGGGLPVTGASLTVLAAVGVALLGLGGLFMFARRRGIRFTV